MSELTIIITIIFIFSFVPLILAEISRVKSMPSIEDFFVCNRSLSTFLYFFTIYSTWYSAFAVMGSSAHFYLNGPVYMTTFAWNALFAICLFFIGRRIWFYGEQHKYMTPSDFFQDIYRSKPLTLLVTIILFVFTLPYVQIQFSGAAYLIDIASHGKIPWEIAGFIFYTIMVVYLWAGGLHAVALTDVFFGTLVFLTMLGTGFLLTREAGGIHQIFHELISDDVQNVTISGAEKDSYNTVLLWLSMFLVTPLGALMSPPIWIRNYAVKKEETFHVIPLLITLVAIGYIGCFLAGNAGKVLDPNLTDSNNLIPSLLVKYGSQISITLLFCGFAAASLSTANSQIHALSAIYTVDIHKRYINQEAKDSTLLKAAKWSVLFFSVIIYLFMVFNPSIIINTGLLALSGTAQLIVPVLGALFWKHSTAAGAFTGLICGVATLLLLYLIIHIEASYCGIIGIVINAIFFFTISLTTKSEPKIRARIIEYKTEFENRN